MSRVKVKICGLTRRADAEHAVACGADYIGLVFAPSPRQLGIDAAVEILKDVPATAGKVALFMNQPESFISGVLDKVDFDLLQFHGHETNDFCRQFGLPFTRAIPMADSHTVRFEFDDFPDAHGLVLDSHATGGAGGSGVVFNWSRVPRSGHRIWLAGGLNPQNVETAIRRVNPWAVDVSSGVERAPGIKDHGLLKSFVEAAHAARPD